MPEALRNISSAWTALPTRQRVRIVVAVLATVGVIWGVAEYSTRVRYGVLFTRLETEDAAQVVTALKERGVPYRLLRGGRSVEVPAGRVDELRMELAGEGLPRGGGIGFEIFDRPAFGLSDFVQNVNYRRALEREVARSIQSLGSIESARVHLALPAESVFADEKKEASASVVVRLAGGSPLSADRVRAITHLTAGGVEGLESSRVSVIDDKGRMLTESGADASDSLSTTQLELKAAMEQRIEAVLISILEPLVGPGKARARATVQLEMASVERIEETFDPDGAVVRSEQKNKSKSRGGGPGGVPGTGSNLPGGNARNTEAGAMEESQESTTNFEINKSVATIAKPRGGLLRQSVAVVIDHATPPQEGADEAAVATTPRTDEEMKQLTDLVRAAVGIDEERGDFLTVENVPFTQSLLENDTAQGLDWVSLVVQLLRYGMLPLVVLLIVLLAIRPGIKALRSLPTAGQAAIAGPPTVAELQDRLGQDGGGATDGRAGLRRKLIEAASENPDAAALVLRGWLDDGTGG